MQWHECGTHLIARSTVELSGAPNTLSIIGCDAANGTYFQLTPTTVACAASIS